MSPEMRLTNLEMIVLLIAGVNMNAITKKDFKELTRRLTDITEQDTWWDQACVKRVLKGFKRRYKCHSLLKN